MSDAILHSFIYLSLAKSTSSIFIIIAFISKSIVKPLETFPSSSHSTFSQRSKTFKQFEKNCLMLSICVCCYSSLEVMSFFFRLSSFKIFLASCQRPIIFLFWFTDTGYAGIMCSYISESELLLFLYSSSSITAWPTETRLSSVTFYWYLFNSLCSFTFVFSSKNGLTMDL